MKYLYLLLIACFTFVSCNTQKEIPTEESTDAPTVEVKDEPTTNRSFIIGEGGGFTGLYKLYKVEESGKVSLYDESKDEYNELGNISKSAIKEIFAELEKINLAEYEYYKPGNYNYRISVSEDVTSRQITWSDTNSPDAEILMFYKKVMNEISNLL